MSSFRPTLPAEKGKGRPPKRMKGRAETLEIVSQPVPTQPHFLVTKAVSYVGETEAHVAAPYTSHSDPNTEQGKSRDRLQRGPSVERPTETTPGTSHLVPSAQSSGTHDGRALHSRGAPFCSAGPVCDHTGVRSPKNIPPPVGVFILLPVLKGRHFKVP